ncbi:MAG: DUF4339 domain-containing protein [Bdellovibrionales bacterium]|nr:DUF4339 domain-containing protein [Bdellovibrionales bacterium]
MGQWYLSKNGKAQGPLEEDQLIAMIQSGEVGHLDLVFQPGASEWIPASEIESFKPHFKKDEPSTPSSDQNADWVILKKIKKENKSEFQQLGPFSQDQVQNLLERGEVSFNDFAWKQGMDSWVAIAQIEEFRGPLPSTPPIDSALYEETLGGQEEVTEEEDISSLSQLVDIQQFEYEKTQVMSAAEFPLNHEEFVTETNASVGPDVFTEEGSRALADLDSGEEALGHEEEVASGEEELWSLKPPETDPGSLSGTDVEEDTVLVDPADRKKSRPAPKLRVKSKSKKKEKRPKKSKESAPAKKKPAQPVQAQTPPEMVGESPWPWVAAAITLVISALFLYLSFKGSREPVAQYDSQSQHIEEGVDSGAYVQNEEPAEGYNNQDPQMSKGLSTPPPPPPMRRKVANQPVQSSEPEVVKARPATATKQKSKKKRVSKRGAKSKASRSVVPQVVKGSSKERSYFVQRDRKAVVYSAIKAEKLMAEIDSKSRTLKNKKSAWRSFYKKWRKKAQVFATPLIRSFPSSKTKYAHPKLLSSFKADQSLLIEYGEQQNAKVLGLRQPASPERNIKKVFGQYKSRAQAL